MRTGRRLIAVLSILWLAALAVRCAPRPAAQPAGPPPLIGDMKGVVSVKELMAHMIDPIADNIFDAVHWTITKRGTDYVRPQDDDDWEKVRVGAVTLAEGIYLLKVPRPTEPAGYINPFSVGPDAPEQTPEQIQAMIDKDPVLWNAKIEALRNAALEVIEIVNRKNIDELFAAGEDLDKACEGCHLEYWYPGDRKAVEEQERQRAGFETKK
jgi:hypothetical protein